MRAKRKRVGVNKRMRISGVAFIKSWSRGNEKFELIGFSKIFFVPFYIMKAEWP